MKTVLQHLTDNNPEAVIIVGFDDCLIGTTHQCGNSHPVAVYSTQMIIDKLEERGLDLDDAWDHYYNHIEIIDMGPHGPFMLNLDID